MSTVYFVLPTAVIVLLLMMPRTWKRETERGKTPLNVVEAAAQRVLEYGDSLRVAAADHNVRAS